MVIRFVIKSHGGFFSSRAELNYDAIVTNRTNLAICIKTADCVPVFFVDRLKKIIAVAHAGWRSTALKISAKVIELMQNQYGSSLQNILVAIGPSIGKCCYQVDSAVADAFRGQKSHEIYLLPASGFCTFCCQDIFFSHRGSGGITGRQINFMMIKEDAPCRVLTLDNKAYWIQ